MGYRDVQRGLPVYRKGSKLSEKPTPFPLTDLDVVAQDKPAKKVIIAQLKDWYKEVPQVELEDWTTNKLNPVIDYLNRDVKVGKDIVCWYVVAKTDELDITKLQALAKCPLSVFSKEGFMDYLATQDPDTARELRAILSK